MKNLLTATLPGLALLALGGCATSGALTTSTETDGVYYSSSDHTTAVAAPVYSGSGSSGNIPARALDDTVPATATTDDANPDYQGGTSQGYATGTDYYSNSYNDGLSTYTPNGSGFNQPYAGPGVSSYNYSPGWAVAPSFYGSPFGYGAGLALGYGYSPYSMGGFGYPYGGGFYDPFYSPFYSPYGLGYGSGLSIGFGYGFGGFGGFGYPYGGFGGYPYGYGYGRGYYGGGYGGGYYAGEPRYRNSAPRSVRGGTVLNGYAPAAGNGGNNGNVNVGNGRRSGAVYANGGLAAPGNPSTAPAYTAGAAGNNNAGNATVMPTRRDGGGGGNVVGSPSYSTPGGRASNGYAMPTTPAGTAGATSPQATGRRGGFFNGFFSNPNGGNPNGANVNSAASPNGGYSQPQRRSYSQQPGGMQNQPNSGYTQPQRSYQQPQQQMPERRSFEPAPQRSYSQPSFGGGGGGSFGGGGGGGGGRRGGR